MCYFVNEMIIVSSVKGPRQKPYLGIFLLSRKPDVALIAHWMVSRAEIVRLQLALVQQCAATAHFRMGIGNVLLRRGFCERSIR